jgi:hypothetical protein
VIRLEKAGSIDVTSAKRLISYLQTLLRTKLNVGEPLICYVQATISFTSQTSLSKQHKNNHNVHGFEFSRLGTMSETAQTAPKTKKNENLNRRILSNLKLHLSNLADSVSLCCYPLRR